MLLCTIFNAAFFFFFNLSNEYTIMEVFFFFFSFQVINDLLNPAGQNLKIREDAQVLVGYILILFLDTVFLHNNTRVAKLDIHIILIASITQLIL